MRKSTKEYEVEVIKISTLQTHYIPRGQWAFFHLLNKLIKQNIPPHEAKPDHFHDTWQVWNEKFQSFFDVKTFKLSDKIPL
jgi:hypothetical protein